MSSGSSRSCSTWLVRPRPLLRSPVRSFPRVLACLQAAGSVSAHAARTCFHAARACLLRTHGRVEQVDEDKGGSISPQELGSLMETLGLKPNQEELDAMIREIDEDGNGEIEFDEFVQVRTRPPPCRRAPLLRVPGVHTSASSAALQT